MTLDHYFKQPGAKTLTAMALEIGVSKGRLSQLRRSTNWPPKLALDVERVTAGAVGASELSHVVALSRAA